MISAILLAAAASTCVDPATADGARLISNGAVACVFQPKPTSDFKARAVNPSEQAAVKIAADLVLRDGPSARWRWPKRLSKDIYCGAVNAKNSFGAYSGWRDFLYFQGDFTLADDKGGSVVVEAICSAAGYIPKPDWLPR